MRLRESFDPRRDALRAQARGVDELPAGQPHRPVGPTHFELETIGAHHAGGRFAQQRQHRTVVFRLTEQREHQPVTVDDAGVG